MFIMARHSDRIQPHRIRVLNAVLNIYGMNINPTKLSSFICAVFNLIFIVYTCSRMIKHALVLSRNYADFFALVYICRYLTYLISRISVLFRLKELIKLYNLVVLEYGAPNTTDSKFGLAITCIPIIWLLTVALQFALHVIVIQDQGIASFLESNNLINIQPSEMNFGYKMLAFGDPMLFCFLDISWFTVVTLIKVLISYVISTRKKRAIELLTNSFRSSTKGYDLRKYRSDWLQTTGFDKLLNQVFECSYFIWICCTFISFSCLVAICRDGIYGHKSNFSSILSEVGINLIEAAFILVTVYFDFLFNHKLNESVNTLIRAESKSIVKNDVLTELIKLIQINANFNLQLYSTFQVNLCLVLKFLEALVPIVVIVIQLKP